MARVTLKQQWDALREELREQEVTFAVNELGNVPDIIYSVNNKGEIRQRSVYSVGNSTIRVYYYGKTPTRDDVARLKYYLNHPIAFQRDKILLYWKEEGELGGVNCTTSGATYFSDLEKSTWDFLDEAKAEAKAAEIKVKRQREKEMLANGGIRCQYCGEVREAKDIHYKSIIAAQYRNMHSEPRPYCRDKGCAGHDQMGHEG